MAADLMVSSVQKSLSSASRLPFDIKFIFKREENGTVHIQDIRAHKFILALVSDVFEKEFYGGVKDDGTVEIKDASKESFEAMINFIYIKKTDMEQYDYEVLCSLYYLADKYNISALKKEVLKAISTKSIPATEILSVGVLADLNSVHEELVETLHEAASQSLSKVLKGDMNKSIDFFNQIDLVNTPISSNGLVQILARMKKNIEQTVCQNCKASPCLSGVSVTRENFVPGAKLGCFPDGYRLHSLDEHDEIMFYMVSKDGQKMRYIFDPDYNVYRCT